jgi:thiol-disulfide isomerase/thioredoxin
MKKLFSAFIFLFFVCATGTVSAQATIPKWKSKDLEQFIQQTDKPTIINFWATFCKPCIEELPYFQQTVRQWNSAGVQLVLVNLDMEEAYPKKIKLFADRFKLTAPVVFLDETDADVFCPVVDKSWSGAIPASLFINNKTGYKKFFEDQLSQAKLEEEIKKMVAPGTAKQ